MSYWIKTGSESRRREDATSPAQRHHGVQPLYPSRCSDGVSLFYDNSFEYFFVNLSENHHLIFISQDFGGLWGFSAKSNPPTSPRRDYLNHSWVLRHFARSSPRYCHIGRKSGSGSEHRLWKRILGVWSALLRSLPSESLAAWGWHKSKQCSRKAKAFSTGSSWAPNTGHGCFVVLSKMSPAWGPCRRGGLSLTVALLIYCVSLLLLSG